ncbi:tannase/feruloyl esterase family alpha/beta hydrolase [Pendulispora rubella]|uniref:Tannase/feruloyl esterase family alpha/beta hydrolase n=1 Tax=Pendulispora rubella TaxID=2741070 RepID=A0ABZ2KPT5_9BACT
MTQRENGLYRRIAEGAGVVVTLAILVPLAVTQSACEDTTDPPANQGAPACAPVAVSAPSGAEVESVVAVRQPGGTVSFPDAPFGPTPAPIADVPASCELTVTLTHPGAGDHVHVKVVLPETGWTGRFQALGGSAYAAGEFGAPLVRAVKNGYAAATTDAGVPLTFLDASWGLAADGTINAPLLTNFASRSVHEATWVGKDVTQKFYHRPISYSYWSGCSTGGRQGYSEAQNFPDDFDGILAIAPAINWSQFAVASLWPQIVMYQEHDFPSTCVFNAFKDAAIRACDARDGVTDGILERPETCDYDPRALAGTKVRCEGGDITVTPADAEVVRKIWAGPTDEHHRPLWPGLPKGADFGGLAATKLDTTGTPFAPGFPVAVGWVQTFLEKRLGFDTSTITYDQFAELFRQSVKEYDGIIGTSNPDLSAFRNAGGRLLTWQGGADQLITPGGTIDYWQRVVQRLGGAPQVDDFYRVFLAPGVAHCEDGNGPIPTNALDTLVDWVEHGKPPDTLPAAITNASGKPVTRNLCHYPQVSSYVGQGDPNEATSYQCVGHGAASVQR